jgi:multidrug efflux pump subunit AcrA (membrane-fusion protein)
MTERTGASWVVYVLGALCAGAVAAAILVVGPASSSQATVTRTATVAQGVVQSTVSGSGNLQAASQLNLGFKTGGTVTHIYVTQGEQVAQGQLLATLDPQSAEVTLEQAKATLQSAEANLAKEEETDGEGSTAGASSGASAGNAATASAASVSDTGAPALATAANAPASASAPPAATTTPTSTAPAAATPTATTPASTAPATTTPSATAPATTAPAKRTTSRKTTSTSTAPAGAGKEAEKEKAREKESISTATREANLASARAAVKSDALTAQSDEQAVQSTKLYAPESGTIVSLSGQVGEVVSASGTTRASSASSSGGSGSSGAGATGASAAGRSATGASSASSSSSSSNSSSSSSFAVLSDLSSMQLVVALSESEIGNVKDGQIATVTVEALEGRKLAAHVSEVALTATSTSGAVSYDVTFQLDQMEPGLKLGMSATAEVVVKQAEGINVPTSAISADSVTVERAGKQVRQRVVTGLAGNTSTIVLSGLKAGETVVLPAAGSTSSGASLTSRLGRRLTGAGAAGGLGGAGGFPGGGAALVRGGG